MTTLRLVEQAAPANSGAATKHKIYVDSTTKKVYSIDSAGTIQILTTDWAAVPQTVLPATDDTYDLGSAAKQWRDLFLASEVRLPGGGLTQMSSGATGHVVLARNARYDGVNWVRLVAEQAASLVYMDHESGISLMQATDVGTTVGSTITWSTRFTMAAATGIITLASGLVVTAGGLTVTAGAVSLPDASLSTAALTGDRILLTGNMTSLYAPASKGIYYDTEVYDTNTMGDTGGTITIKATGLYEVSFSGHVNINSLQRLGLAVNGSEYLSYPYDLTFYSFSTPLALTLNDTLKMTVFGGSGGNNQQACIFSVRRIG